MLGPIEVWRGEENITPTSSGERTLLALLALQPGESVSIRTISDHLWPGYPPHQSANMLYTYVSRLRARLEPGRARRVKDGVLSSSHGTYRLRVGANGLDLLAFRERIGRARQAGAAADACDAYEEALSLWRGEVAADVDIGAHPALTRLADERMAATGEYAEFACGRGRHRTALPYLRTAAASNPLHGAVHAWLMLVLAGLGQHAEALRVFEEIRTRLRDALGADPDPVLRDAHARVLAEDTPAGPRDRHWPAPVVVREQAPAGLVPRQLPPRLAAFTGRSAELAEIGRSLGAVAGRPPATVLIGGMPGVGKSALAILAAYQASAAFPDGVLYADLSNSVPGACPVAALEVLRSFLRALDPCREWTPASEREAVGRYRSLIASRRILVVLDDAASAVQVRPLLPTGEGSAALVTSRQTLASLDATAAVTVRPLGYDDSLGMLTGMIPGARLQREAAAAAIICRACEGLPLALRIVGAQSVSRPSWPVTRMASRLRDKATRLAALRHGDLSVATSLRTSIELLADNDATRSFAQLGILTTSDISLGAAQALLDLPGWRAERALERLADAHLLDSPFPGWYRMHGLLRLFSADLARTELAESELRALRSRARRLPGHPVPVEGQRQDL